MIQASSSSNHRNKERWTYPTSTVVTALIGGGTIVSASVALGIYIIPKCVSGGQWNCVSSEPSGTQAGLVGIVEMTGDETRANVPTSLNMTTMTNVTNTTNTTKTTIMMNMTSMTNITNTSSDSFRLRLHWQSNYWWQEVNTEEWFCAACATCNPTGQYGGRKNCIQSSNCMEDMMLALVDCKPTSLVPSNVAEFVKLKSGATVPFNMATDGFDGDQIQAQGTNLCLTKITGGANFTTNYTQIFLKPCDSTIKEQQFFGQRAGVGYPMEIKPYPKKGSQCMSNHHHPLLDEQIYAESCNRSRIATNNLWCPFSGNSSMVGECVLDPSVIVNPPKITTNTTNTTNTPSLTPPATTALSPTLAGTTAPPVVGTLLPATIAPTTGGTTAGITAFPISGTLPPTSIAPMTTMKQTTMIPTIKKPTSVQIMN